MLRRSVTIARPSLAFVVHKEFPALRRLAAVRTTATVPTAPTTARPLFGARASSAHEPRLLCPGSAAFSGREAISLSRRLLDSPARVWSNHHRRTENRRDPHPRVNSPTAENQLRSGWWLLGFALPGLYMAHNNAAEASDGDSPPSPPVTLAALAYPDPALDDVPPPEGVILDANSLRPSGSNLADPSLRETFERINWRSPWSLWKAIWYRLRFVARSATIAALWFPVIISKLVLSDRRWSDYVVWTLTRCGPAWIKLGQWAATRVDLFPMALCRALSQLQHQSVQHTLQQSLDSMRRAFPAALIVAASDQTLARELLVGHVSPKGQSGVFQIPEATLRMLLERVGRQGAPAAPELRDIIVLGEVVGSGSVAQVHRAVHLHRQAAQDAEATQDSVWSTERTCVKILHPGVRDTVFRDVQLMCSAADAIHWTLTTLPFEFTRSIRWLDLPGAAYEFAGLMRSQLDLRIEAGNMKRFRRNFRIDASDADSDALQQDARMEDGEPEIQEQELKGQDSNTPGIASTVVAALQSLKDRVSAPLSRSKQVLSQHSPAAYAQSALTAGVMFPKPHLELTHADCLVEEFSEGALLAKLLALTPCGDCRDEGCSHSTSASAVGIDAIPAAAGAPGPLASPKAAPCGCDCGECAIQWNDYSRRHLARTGQAMFLQMMVHDNFVHSDLHPGNLIVRDSQHTPAREGVRRSPAEQLQEDVQWAQSVDGGRYGCICSCCCRSEHYQLKYEAAKRPIPGESKIQIARRKVQLIQDSSSLQIVVLDPGLVTELAPINRRNFLSVFGMLVTGNGRKAAELMLTRAQEQECDNVELFLTELDALVQNVPIMTVGNVAVGPLLQRVLNIARTHKVRLDSNFVTMFVSIALLEGIGRQLQPDLSLFGSALPHLLQNAECRAIMWETGASEWRRLIASSVLSQ